MEDLSTKITNEQLTAAEFVQPMSEIQKVITESGQTLTNTDVNQLYKAIGATVPTKAAALLLEIVDGKKVFITSADGGIFTMRTGAAIGTYNDNGGVDLGTKFTNGDGSDGFSRDSETIPILPISTNTTLTPEDTSSIILVDASAGDITITLPDVTTVTVMNQIKVIKNDVSTNTVIINSVSEQILDEGPLYNVTGAIDNGAGLIELTTEEQRMITTGTRALVANVGGVPNANGQWTMADTTQLVTDLVGSVFSGTYTSGGTIQFIRESIVLRNYNEHVTLRGNVTKWINIDGSIDTYPQRDVLIGENVGYPGQGGSNNLAAPIDFVYDAFYRRVHLRSLLMTEIGDTPEMGLRRAGGEYPNGPNLVASLSSEALGLIHFTGWAGVGGFGSRSGQMYCRAAEDITPTNAGGRLIFGTTPKTTAAGTVDALEIDSEQRLLINNSSATGKLNSRDDAGGIAFTAQNQSLSASGYMTAFDGHSVGASGWDFIRMRSNNGADIEFQFRGDGNAFADGAFTGGGADYAEYFESIGVLNVGDTVSMVNGFIVKASNTDGIIGVVRPSDGSSSAVIGNAAYLGWNKKYLTDDYGGFLKEDVETVSFKVSVYDKETDTINIETESYYVNDITDDLVIPDNAVYTTVSSKVLNPDYKKDKEYIPRANRKEWYLIGMLGQIPVNNRSKIPGNWIKIRDISKKVSLYIVK